MRLLGDGERVGGGGSWPQRLNVSMARSGATFVVAWLWEQVFLMWLHSAFSVKYFVGVRPKRMLPHLCAGETSQSTRN